MNNQAEHQNNHSPSQASSDVNTGIIREFGLTSFSVNNVTSVFVIIFLIVLLGAVAYQTMPRESFPEIKVPTIYIGTAYPGNSPLDMENLVTRPIEKELKGITGIKKIESTSIQDYSTVIVEFALDMLADEALVDVKDAVDRAKPDLPNDLPTDPNIFEMNFSEFPVMNVDVSGINDLDLLKSYAEYLQEEIEKFPEITRVDIRGVPEKEMTIRVDIQKLEARRLSFQDIEGAIAAENVTMSGGDILNDNLRKGLRIVGEFDNAEEIENIIISNEKGAIVYLRDVATVDFGYEDTQSYARSDGKPVITCDIIKQSGGNLLDASDKIKALIAEAKTNKFPESVAITITNDQSKTTRSMVSNLENSIVTGVIFVVLVLLFFMGLRNALFVGVAIPLSMLMGFLILGFSGVTLNMMVLFSLILALGMLVDNGIVVVENIYRLMSEGMPPVRAAKEGAGEVAWPIIASTATTLAAFLPLLFWNDIMGEFMKFLPITLIIVLASSLFVALVINPVLTSVFMRLDDPTDKFTHRTVIKWVVIAIALCILFYAIGNPFMGGLFLVFALLVPINAYFLYPQSLRFQEHAVPAMERGYAWFMRVALKGWRPIGLFLGTFVLLFASINLLQSSGLRINLFPINEPNYVNIFVKYPIGTDIERTNAFTEEIEKVVFEEMKEYDYMIESVLAKVGEGTSDPNEGPQQGNSPNKARITISFLEYEHRKGQSTGEILEQLREATAGYGGDVEITLAKDAVGPPTGAAINIEVSGEDFDRLIVLSNEMKRYLEEASVPGVEKLKLDLEERKPEILLEIDRDKARRFGLSTGQIGSTIRTAVFGKEISKYKDGEDDYPIQLRFNEDIRYNLAAVLDQRVTFRNNQGKLVQVAISDVVNTVESSTYGAVKRKDLDRVVSIFSNVKEGYNGTEIVQRYQQLLSNYEIPDGYDVKFTGEQEEQAESTAFLVNAMGVAVALIFLIIVSQFNSVAMPFIIVLSILFSTIGVFLGYVLFNMDFIIIMTGIGIISLAGVVVNNAIVLIDYINLVRNRQRLELNLPEGQRETKSQLVDAIVFAGSKRLRPVLLTAITTVLGLIPLATGLNINFYTLLSEFDPQIYWGGDNAIFWGPMAWTVIFGLIFATFLTLVIVPVMYLLIERLSARLFGSQPKNQEAELQLMEG